MANSREMADQAFALLQDALRNSEERAARLDSELKRERAPKNQSEHQIQVLEHRLDTLQAECERWRKEAGQLTELLENERARSRQLKKRLDGAESGPDKVGKKEVNYWRARVEQFDADTEQYRQRIAELREELKAAHTEVEIAGSQVDDQLRARDARIAEQSARMAALEAESADRQRRIDELGETRKQAEARHQELKDRFAALEDELREEKECTINLSEIANERRDQISELSEKLDEALERYAEAQWNLERASRFERLVRKRRKLIDSLIEGLRAKHKANTALKAGIDGLRKFKARAEDQQQKALVRVEELSHELRETRERLAQQRNASASEEKLRKSAELVSSLEDKVSTQLQVIERLETDLAAARAARQTTEKQTRETEELRSALSELNSALAAKDSAIAELEKDLNEQQKQLAKLRGSESETLRLQALNDKDQSLIDDLRLEIDSLKGELLRLLNSGDAGMEGPGPEAAAELRKRDSQIADLRRKTKDQEREIARLNEAVSGWQKKYEFLSADSPPAYQSTVVEK